MKKDKRVSRKAFIKWLCESLEGGVSVAVPEKEVDNIIDELIASGKYSEGSFVYKEFPFIKNHISLILKQYV